MRPRLALAAALVLFAAVPAPAPAQSAPIAEATRLFEAERFDEAERIVQPIAAGKSADAAAANFWMGRIAAARGDFKGATGWFERAVKLDDRSSEYHLWLGRGYGAQAMTASMVRKMSLAGKIKQEFERAVQLDPDNLDARTSLIDFYLAAPGIAGGSKEKARAEALEIRRRNPWRGTMQYLRVLAAGDDEAALQQEYAAAVRAYPDSMALPVALAIHYQSKKQFARSFEVLEQTLRQRPGEMSALYQLGRTAVLSGEQLDRGEAALRRYLERKPPENQPSHAAAHWRLGMIQERRGDKAKARAEYQAALALDPKHRETQEALKKLK